MFAHRESIPDELSPSNYPGRHVARDLYPQRQVAREGLDLSLGIVRMSIMTKVRFRDKIAMDKEESNQDMKLPSSEKEGYEEDWKQNLSTLVA
ncbi:hypothetical protein Tco_0373369 [Tanacetum coccineum]